MFEFGEDLFDRVQIGGVGREEEEFRASSPDGSANGGGFVAAEVVQYDDVVWPQGWD